MRSSAELYEKGYAIPLFNPAGGKAIRCMFRGKEYGIKPDASFHDVDVGFPMNVLKLVKLEDVELGA